MGCDINAFLTLNMSYYCAVCDHSVLGPLRGVQDRSGPFGIVQDCLGLFVTIQDHSGPLGTVRDHSRSCGKAILNSGFALYHVLHPAMLIPMLCHFQNCLSFHSSPIISHVGIFEQDRKFLECRLQCKPQQRKFKWL